MDKEDQATRAMFGWAALAAELPLPVHDKTPARSCRFHAADKTEAGLWDRPNCHAHIAFDTDGFPLLLHHRRRMERMACASHPG
jgi:hypothetical protein